MTETARKRKMDRLTQLLLGEPGRARAMIESSWLAGEGVGPLIPPRPTGRREWWMVEWEHFRRRCCKVRDSDIIYYFSELTAKTPG